MLSVHAREEEIKNYIGEEFFADYDSNKILGNIDFCVCHKETTTANPKLTNLDIPINSYLWAEAKKGNKADIYASFVQLILTIGKQKAFSKYNPPLFLGAFDSEKMAFLIGDYAENCRKVYEYEFLK